MMRARPALRRSALSQRPTSSVSVPSWRRRWRRCSARSGSASSTLRGRVAAPRDATPPPPSRRQRARFEPGLHPTRCVPPTARCTWRRWSPSARSTSTARRRRTWEPSWRARRSARRYTTGSGSCSGSSVRPHAQLARPNGEQARGLPADQLCAPTSVAGEAALRKAAVLQTHAAAQPRTEPASLWSFDDLEEDDQYGDERGASPGHAHLRLALMAPRTGASSPTSRLAVAVAAAAAAAVPPSLAPGAPKPPPLTRERLEAERAQLAALQREHRRLQLSLASRAYRKHADAAARLLQQPTPTGPVAEMVRSIVYELAIAAAERGASLPVPARVRRALARAHAADDASGQPRALRLHRTAGRSVAALACVAWRHWSLRRCRCVRRCWRRAARSCCSPRSRRRKWRRCWLDASLRMCCCAASAPPQRATQPTRRRAMLRVCGSTPLPSVAGAGRRAHAECAGVATPSVGRSCAGAAEGDAAPRARCSARAATMGGSCRHGGKRVRGQHRAAPALRGCTGLPAGRPGELQQVRAHRVPPYSGCCARRVRARSRLLALCTDNPRSTPRLREQRAGTVALHAAAAASRQRFHGRASAAGRAAGRAAAAGAPAAVNGTRRCGGQGGAYCRLPGHLVSLLAPVH